MLEDKEEDEGLTTNWKKVEEAIELLIKRERRKDTVDIQRPLQTCHVKVPTTNLTSMIQPFIVTSKKEEMGIDKLIRGMKDLQIKFAKFEEKGQLSRVSTKQRLGSME